MLAAYKFTAMEEVESIVVIYPKRGSYSYKLLGKKVKGKLLDNDTELLVIRSDNDSNVYIIPVADIEFIG